MKGTRRPKPGEYLELWLASSLRWLPFAWTSAVGAYLGTRRGRQGIAAERRWVKRLHHNLERLCHVQDPDERERRIIGFTSRIGRQFSEYMVLQKIAREGRLDLVGLEHLQQLSEPVILASCHLANWELVGYLLTLLDAPTCALHDPPENPIRHRLATEARQRWRSDLRLVKPSPRAMRQISKALANGHNLLMYVDEVTDGYAMSPSLGRHIPYSGNRWLTARLAVRFQRELIPVRVERLAQGRFRIIISPPLVAQGKDDEAKARSLADQLDRLLNAWIEAQPEHWYFLFELDLDKPMPAS